MNRKTQRPDRYAPPPAPGADGDVLPALLRYRGRYRWRWNLSMRLINLYYGTRYTEKQLKTLYKNRST